MKDLAMNITKKSTLLIAGAFTALSLSLTGCVVTGTAVEDDISVAVKDSDSLTLVEGWAKATDNMTGVFGILVNPGSEDVNLVSASSPVAGMVELHETSVVGGASQMQEKPEGFIVPAGDGYLLEPGGDHIMLMDLERELLPGEDLPLTLEFSDGTTVDLLIDVRDFSGAIEEYAPGDHDDHANHGGDHGEGDDE